MKNLKKGEEVYYRNDGYGLTSYEGPDLVIGKRKGRLLTTVFDRDGLEWDEKRKAWTFDGGLGLTTIIVSKEEGTKGGEK